MHRVDHIAGFYYISSDKRTYLPLTNLSAHTTILSIASQTVLKQQFINPSQDAIPEIRYTFPLYAGISVVEFVCKIEDRTISGIVKERQDARNTYEEAKASGKTAGLLEQSHCASDVFTTTIGNVPAGASIEAQITYVGELTSDAEGEGTTRFTIPTQIAPRYGSYPGDASSQAGHGSIAASGEKIDVVVDVRLAEGSVIREVRSPSHPVAISMGVTSEKMDADPDWSRASATLSLGSAELGTDFVLMISSKDSSKPKAVLEEHSQLQGQRALMASFVPKFAVKAGTAPEIVFVCDRSGSMRGKMNTVRDALHVFLKSLPKGCLFNLCSFGSSHSFLWEQSQSYTQQSLDTAMSHVDTFDANYGGTEIFGAVSATLKKRYGDIPIEVILLTDGQIHDQERLFLYLNQQVQEAKIPIRVFTLGIGDQVSHSLIEGVAKAGNGFSQAILTREKLDQKIVRMLKGALSPHIVDLTFEVKYDEAGAETDEEWEVVDKISDSLNVKLRLDESQHSANDSNKETSQPKTISLYDENIDVDAEQARNVPDAGPPVHVEAPKLLQAPSKIASLFPFIRTYVYILLDPSTAQKTPKSVVFRGTVPQGPLELEIPVETPPRPGLMIHQLAARKAISELDEGRGWLTLAKDDTGTPLNQSYASQYQGLVKSESVRLGTRFQIGGKHTSFIAVEDGNEHEWPGGIVPAAETEDYRPRFSAQKRKQNRHSPTVQLYSFGSNPSPRSIGYTSHAYASPHIQGTLFGSPAVAQYCSSEVPRVSYASYASYDSASLGSELATSELTPEAVSLDDSSSTPSVNHSSAKRRARRLAMPPETNEPFIHLAAEVPEAPGVQATHGPPLKRLIRLQTFEGFWEWDKEMFAATGVSESRATAHTSLIEPLEVAYRVVATLVVITWMEKFAADDEAAWELMVAKAHDWLDGQIPDMKKAEIWSQIRSLLEQGS